MVHAIQQTPRDMSDWIETETIYRCHCSPVKQQPCCFFSFIFWQQVVPDCPILLFIYFLDRTLQKSAVAKFRLLTVAAQSIWETAMLWSHSFRQKFHHLTETNPFTSRGHERYFNTVISWAKWTREVWGGRAVVSNETFTKLTREDTRTHSPQLHCNRDEYAWKQCPRLCREQNVCSVTQIYPPRPLSSERGPAQCAAGLRLQSKCTGPLPGLSQRAATAACLLGLLAESELSTTTASSSSSSVT